MRMYGLVWLSIFNFMFSYIHAYFVSVDETKFHLAKSYLCRYGYMNENLCQQHADDSLKFMQNNARDMYRGLLIFQTMFNITRTGKIDEETIMQMSKPRCGNKDFDLHFNSLKFSSHKANDFTALRSGLKKLTYTIRKYNPYLNRYSKYLSDDIVEYTIDRAFQIWLKHLSDHVRVNRVSENDDKHMKSNITIYFAEGNHGDSMLFDGIDGELAHSYSLSNLKTPFRGHIHLDDAENWGKDKRLLNIMLHEIGHIFGLDHSSNPRSIMSPLFRYDNAEIQTEDVRNLRLLLGLDKHHTDRKTTNEKDLTTTTTPAPTTTTTNANVQTTTVAQETTKEVKLTSTTVNVPSTSTAVSIEASPVTTEIKELDNTKSNSYSISQTVETEVPNKPQTEPIPIEKESTKTTTTTTPPISITFTTVTITTTTSEKSSEETPVATTLEVLTTTSTVPTTTTSISTTTLVSIETTSESTTITPSPTTTTTTTTTTTSTTTITTPIDTTFKVIDTTTDDSIDAVIEVNVSNTTKQIEKTTTTTETVYTPESTTIETTTILSTTTEDRSTTQIVTEESTSSTVPSFTTTTIATTSLPITELLTTETVKESSTEEQQATTKSLLTTIINDLVTSTETRTTTVIDSTTTTTTTTTTVTYNNEPSNLCEDPHIDAITRTEWGNAFVFKGDYVWHIRGLTKWRLFDYEGWPKLINQIFPNLPSNIDSSFLYDDQYFFTKGDQIWKYKIASTYYPPKYLLVKSYPKAIKEEFPNLPFDRVDGAFAVSSSVFLFKDSEFWQSEWTSNITGKIPFKVDAVLSWRNPRLDTGLNEPLAYVISNSSMYKFNYWSFPVSYEALDIRYFLFDCVQANYQPNNAIFLGPSYKQAFIADDIYNKELSAFNVPPLPARLIADNNKTNVVASDNVKSESIPAQSQTNNAMNLFNFNLFSFFSILTAFIYNYIN